MEPRTFERDLSIIHLQRVGSILSWWRYRLPVDKASSCSFPGVVHGSACIASGSRSNRILSEEFGGLLLESLGHVTFLRSASNCGMFGPCRHDSAGLSESLATE